MSYAIRALILCELETDPGAWVDADSIAAGLHLPYDEVLRECQALATVGLVVAQAGHHGGLFSIAPAHA